MANLSRFLTAHERDLSTALTEIRQGRKRSHWMWYIFPQLLGLGHSETSKFYALKNIEEAEAFLNHPVLGKNLITISETLMELEENDAYRIFGSPDDLKLKSCMTLFSLVSHTSPIFTNVLAKFFHGQDDRATMLLIQNS